ncbi:hypothetical protein CRUP_017115 [Coryphaenoides rupestris]|nr:hypothetical protein CRUP_017115 [Coryphaenoides rupestris]
MTSAAPSRKPYRRAPPQHRETRPHAPHLYGGGGEQPLGPPPPPPPPPPPTPPQGAPLTSHRQGGVGWSAPSWWAPPSDSDPDASSFSSLDLPHASLSPPTSHFSSSNSTLGVPAAGAHYLTAAAAGGGLERSASTSPTLSFREEVQVLSPADRRPGWGSGAGAAPPKSILKRPGGRRDHDLVGKSKSVEDALDRNQNQMPGRVRGRSLDRPLGLRAERRSSLPAAPPPHSSGDWKWRPGVLEEKVKFSGFLDEITCRVLSPAHLKLLGRKPQPSSSVGRRGRGRSQAPREPAAEGDRGRRRRAERPWEGWVSSTLHRQATHTPWPHPQQATPTSCRNQGGGEGHGGPRPPGPWPKEVVLVPAERPGGRGETEHEGRSQPSQQEVPTPHRKSKITPSPPTTHSGEQKPDPSLSFLSQIKEDLSDADRIRILQQQNDELHRCLSHSNHKMESMEAEFENSRHYMQTELSRTQDDLDKMRDKFRR